MAVKVKCAQCGTQSKQGIRFCPNCGETLEGAEIVTDSSKTLKLIGIIVGAVVLLASAIVGTVVFVSNMNPTGKYQRLVENGQIEEANALYADKIAGEEELAEVLAEEEAAKIDSIYEEYVSGSVSYDDARASLESYKQSEASKDKANAIQKDMDALKKSRDSFEQAEQAEADEDYDKAISKYKLVIETDSNYATAQKKIEEIENKRRNDFITEAANYASNSKYSDAIATINKAIQKCGSDDELTGLLEEYTTAKSEQYVKVTCVDKGVRPKNTSKWQFSDYVMFVFEVKNNSDKDIKGVEGVLYVNDLFGKEILFMGCDFTGQIIKAGETYIEDGLYLECNEFIDEHMKLYNTDYSDLQFSYEVTGIVFADGTSVKPD